MYNFVIGVYVVVSLLIILLVMLQHGKGAEQSTSFGAGAQSAFGSSGGGSFLTRLTTVLAAAFFLLSLVIGNMNARNLNSPEKSKWEELSATETTEISSHVESEIPVAKGAAVASVNK